MSEDLPQINFDILKATKKLIRDVEKFKSQQTYRELVAAGNEGHGMMLMAQKLKVKHTQLYDNFLAIFKAVVQGEMDNVEQLTMLLQMRAAVDSGRVSLDDADKAVAMKFFTQYKKD